jgi:ferrous iron transport protein A
MNLSQMPLGQPARVSAIALSLDLAQRLAALGLRIDSEVTVLRRGWLGGPLQLRVGGTELMLRRDAAAQISVVLQSQASPLPLASAEVVA